MPITPLHLGPGAVFKAIGGRRFSFVVFGLAQFAMDLEPIGRFLGGSNLLHGPVHSLLGATIVGAIVVVLGKPLGERLLRLWNWRLSPRQRVIDLGQTWGRDLGSSGLGVRLAILQFRRLLSIISSSLLPFSNPFGIDSVTASPRS